MITAEIALYQYMQANLLTHHCLKTIPFINCIRNPNLHEELHRQHKKFKEIFESNTFDASLDSLEMQRQDHHSDLNQTIESFWQQHTPLAHQRQNLTAIQMIVTQIFSNITNRLTCLGKYNKRFLHI